VTAVHLDDQCGQAIEHPGTSDADVVLHSPLVLLSAFVKLSANSLIVLFSLSATPEHKKF